MGLIFCTSCGRGLAIGARFCEVCGTESSKAITTDTTNEADVKLAGLAPVSTTRKEVIKKARLVVSSWVMPFNATLVFGSTLVAVFDFLSPRIALLPIAATVAVVLLIGIALLRKFFAPQLPDGSTFKALLAPQAAMHRSPLLVMSVVLSTLMVTGAAWSSATASNGGIIASNFDAARNAQMQLGVMQGLQKEQRMQTAVMEDIREGRAVNPRRELANQGTLWSENEFRYALDRGDTQVSTLFLTGGMAWKLHYSKKAFENDDVPILQLLLKYPQLLIQRSQDCPRLMSDFSKTSRDISRVSLGSNVKKVEQAHQLTSNETLFLKSFCSTPADLAHAKEELLKSKKNQQEALDAYNKVIAGKKPVAQCIQEVLENSGRKLMDDVNNFNILSKSTYSEYETLLAEVQIKMMTGKSNSNTDIDNAVKSYCKKQENSKPNISIDPLMTEGWKQIVNVLN